MKKKKNYKISSLVSLYLNYIFQKKILFILGLSLLIMVVILILIANPSLSSDEYLLSYNDIHVAYFEQSLFVVLLFNSVIITTIDIVIIIDSKPFDSLFLSYVPRYLICIVKLIVVFLTMLLIILIEVIALYLIPLIAYKLYKTNIDDLYTVILLLVSTMFELMIEVSLSTLISSIFVPMTMLFIFIVIKVLVQSMNRIKNILSHLMPIIEIKNQAIYSNGLIIGIIWIILLSFIYYSIYNIKDLKLI